MMEGITILAQETVELFTWGFSILGMILIIIAVLLLIGSFFLSINDYDEVTYIVLLLSVCVGAVSFVSFSCAKPDETYEQYKVTIDNSVSLREFNERYEILDQERKIFTIREKEKGESN